MEKNDDVVHDDYDTDLDDDQTDQTYQNILPRLSFAEKLAIHRSNRLTDTFSRSNTNASSSFKTDQENNDETLVPISSKALRSMTRTEIYEKACQLLDITSDWQIRALLSHDTIILSDRPFSFNDFRAFATAIGSNLRELTLHSVKLTSRSFHVLCQSLKQCHHLTLLDLSDNKIGRKGFDYLIDILNDLPLLLYLSLAHCSLQDSFGIRIQDLCRHENLIELNICGNEFEENACIFLGNALKDNKCLSYLNISWNLIRSFASIALFRGLEVNQNLTELDLSWSGLSYDGSVALRHLLTVNKILQYLNISNCNIEWISARMISQGLAKNKTLKELNLSYNPITTHGVQDVIQALHSNKQSAISMLDISGILVFSTSVRLAEKIAQHREFQMRYDCEIPVHDILGQKTTTKGDSMRKIVEHIDKRNWRTLEYFRMLDKQNQFELNRKKVTTDIVKSGIELDYMDVKNIHHRLTNNGTDPLTYKSFHTIVQQQRLRDRTLKILRVQQVKALKKRNRKILETVNQHFPDIEIVTRYEKHKESIEKLARPRAVSVPARR